MTMFPPAGVLLPPQENTQFFNPPPGPSYDWAFARFLQAVAQDRAWTANQVRLQNYLNITLGNWFDYNYSTGRLPYDSKPPLPPGEIWVGTDYDGSMFVSFIQVERPEYPLCTIAEDAKGWTINDKFYRKLPPPQH